MFNDSQAARLTISVVLNDKSVQPEAEALSN